MTELSKEFLESQIAKVTYFECDDGTVQCNITHLNGFVFIGKADIEQCDDDEPNQVAYDAAINKMQKAFQFYYDNQNKTESPYQMEYAKIANAVDAPIDCTADDLLEELSEHYTYLVRHAAYQDLMMMLEGNADAQAVLEEYFDDVILLADEAEDEPYQVKDTDQFTLELAIALAQNGDAVRSVNTGTVLTLDDCGQDALWQLAPKQD